MSEHAGNVVVRFRRRETGEGRATRPEALSTALKQIDELSYHLRQFSPQPSWSAQRWMIDSTPFRMRLGRARNGLGELAKVDLDSRQSLIRWTIKFNTVRFEAQRRLDDIDACVYRLQCLDASYAERAGETKVFTVSRSEFLRTYGKIRNLIDERFD